MKRALLVTNIPTPYRIPLFNELNRQLEQQGVQLKVLFGALGYRRRKWKVDMAQCDFDHDVLSSRSFELFGDSEKTLFTYGGLFKHINALNPDVMVITGFSAATMKVWLRSWFDPIPYIIWTGSLKARAPSRWRSLQRRILVRRASGFIAYGTKTKNYLIELGAPIDNISVGINTVDTEFFASEAEKHRHANSRPEGQKHLLTIGYLSSRKNNLTLLKAVNQIAKRRTDFVLDIIGEGKDRPRLEHYVEKNGLTGQVNFHGYKQREKLPGYLAQSRCFLFPSDYDIWGLVVVEAMAAGLPVIASAKAGATPDLIQEGLTGFVTDFVDIDAVVERINWVLDHSEEARAMGKRASAFISEHATIEKSAAGFVETILDVLGREAPPQEPSFERGCSPRVGVESLSLPLGERDRTS